MKKIKISELPLAQSVTGLFTIATNSGNQSVKVSLEGLVAALENAISLVSGAVQNETSRAQTAEGNLHFTGGGSDLTEAINDIAQALYNETQARIQALSGYVNNGGYNSNAKTIELKNGSTVIASIDATAFIKDGMIDSVTISNGYLVITFNTDAGKEQIKLSLTQIFDPDNYYTRTAIDGMIGELASSLALLTLKTLGDDAPYIGTELTTTNTAGFVPEDPSADVTTFVAMGQSTCSKAISLKKGTTIKYTAANGRLHTLDSATEVAAGVVAHKVAVAVDGELVYTAPADCKAVLSGGSDLVTTPASYYYTKLSLSDIIKNKVDKVTGKGLSSNDYTDTEKSKLGALPTAAELLAGLFVPALSENLKSWAERDELSKEDTWTDPVRTTAGDLSIVSSKGGKLVSIKAKTDFFASALKATGFNLLNGAIGVGAGYYFVVPRLPFGVYGTAEEPNGILFTDNEGNNLKPTVYFKALSAGVPTSVTDGSACAYTDSNGYRFYTTSQPGYIIVSGITYADTCAHVAWSKRYNEFISPSDSADAGSSIALTDLFKAVHTIDANTGLLISLGESPDSPNDYIEFTGANTAKWWRMADRVKPTWTNTEDEVEEGQPQTYTHTATISGMKANGIVKCGNISLLVEGNVISYTDNNASATTDWVKFELAAPVSGTISLSQAYSLEDWGLEILVSATGTAFVTTMYAQGYPDSLAAIAQIELKKVVNQVAENAEKIDALEVQAYTPVAEADFAGLPCLMGQPMKLFGAGTPQNAVIPRNWKQFLDGGYDWNGLPSALGQEYINTAVASGGHYIAVPDGNNLKWQNV